MAIEIKQANVSQLDDARKLFREYERWLGLSLCFQNFDEEVATLPGEYAPPDGRLLLAFSDERLAGCVALRRIGEDSGEIKRLFLRPEFRGQGLGSSMIDRIIKEARAVGYHRLRLDTLPGKMDQAIGLYHSFGFTQIPPYYDNPYPDTIFMELIL